MSTTLGRRARRSPLPGLHLLPEMTGRLRSIPEALSAYLTPPIRVEEYVSGDRYVVRAEVAGADPEQDLEVRVESGRLTIREERGHPAAVLHRSELRHGTLTRMVPLPRDADEDDVTARYDKGVLEVSVHLTGQVPARRVGVTWEGTPAHSVEVRQPDR